MLTGVKPRLDHLIQRTNYLCKRYKVLRPSLQKLKGAAVGMRLIVVRLDARPPSLGEETITCVNIYIDRARDLLYKICDAEGIALRLNLILRIYSMKIKRISRLLQKASHLLDLEEKLYATVSRATSFTRKLDELIAATDNLCQKYKVLRSSMYKLKGMSRRLRLITVHMDARRPFLDARDIRHVNTFINHALVVVAKITNGSGIAHRSKLILKIHSSKIKDLAFRMQRITEYLSLRVQEHQKEQLDESGVELTEFESQDEEYEDAFTEFEAEENSAKIEKGREHVEEDRLDSPSSLSFTEEANHGESLSSSKVIVGTSDDLAAFYTHLATRELQSIKNTDLEFIKELGSGTYGTVYHGKWKGSDVAIKKIKPSCFTDGVLEDRLLADFCKEAHSLGQLHHPNVVAFYGVVTDGPVTDLATVTEYMVNGSLRQVLQRKDQTIDHRKRMILAMDAAFGMEYLHEKSIVHFDLKSNSFLVNMRDPQRPVCKIGDLGLSKIKQRTLVSGGLLGSVPWIAPELLNSNGKNNLVTEKVDVYSFGIVMWELLTGEEPYGNLCTEEIIGGIIKGNLHPEIPSWCDPTWRSLMERCWSSDPESRPPFSEISKELRAMSQVTPLELSRAT